MMEQLLRTIPKHHGGVKGVGTPHTKEKAWPEVIVQHLEKNVAVAELKIISEGCAEQLDQEVPVYATVNHLMKITQTTTTHLQCLSRWAHAHLQLQLMKTRIFEQIRM